MSSCGPLIFTEEMLQVPGGNESGPSEGLAEPTLETRVSLPGLPTLQLSAENLLVKAMFTLWHLSAPGLSFPRSWASVIAVGLSAPKKRISLGHSLLSHAVLSLAPVLITSP